MEAECRDFGLVTDTTAALRCRRTHSWGCFVQDQSLPAVARAGGYYATAGRDASILLRMKEDQDNAEPAASSVALANLARLAALAAPGSVPSANSGHHCFECSCFCSPTWRARSKTQTCPGLDIGG